MNGGERIAAVLAERRVPVLFTLCGGHISPILVSASRAGIRVVDVRDEKSAVFAADAVARLSGQPGVAAVTAGPGVSNTVTAVKNALLAQSPVVLLGGATATALRGRGALQDIDQLALMRPHVKLALAVETVRDLAPALERAFTVAASGVPGPVFVEVPVDLLYGEQLVREWYGKASGPGRARGLTDRAVAWYLERHVDRLFAPDSATGRSAAEPPERAHASPAEVRWAAERLTRAERPVLLVGSQATLDASGIESLRRAVGSLGLPVYLSGMARGLLGTGHPCQVRHRRREALRQADLVLLAGVPCDFRLDYGRHIRRRAVVVSVNRSREDLKRNRRPNLGLLADPGEFLRALAEELRPVGRWDAWVETLCAADREREAEIERLSEDPCEYLNPLALCRAIDRALDEDSVVVADGGDFVATAAYTVSPRGPLRWLDPGVYGTLGVGGGFALGARLCRPAAEVWLLWGDGSAAFSLAELDTFARHGLSLIAVVGNDAGWTQIAREQVEVLGDDTGTVLARTAYHQVAAGYGAVGLLLERSEDTEAVLAEAKAIARSGRPVLINAMLGRTTFRKGSISM